MDDITMKERLMEIQADLEELQSDQNRVKQSASYNRAVKRVADAIEAEESLGNAATQIEPSAEPEPISPPEGEPFEAPVEPDPDAITEDDDDIADAEAQPGTAYSAVDGDNVETVSDVNDDPKGSE